MTVPAAAAPSSRTGRATRSLWRALTARGRVLIVAGLLCITAAQIVGERDLLRVGALLIALPLAGAAIVARARYRMKLVRTLTPKRIDVGSAARVLLRLENVSRLPSDTLLMEDTLPYALGGRPRFVLRQVESGGVREATYTVRPQARGRHDVGPLTVRVSDPFGCVELTRSFSSRETLIVSPKIVPLPAVSLGGDGYRGGDGRSSQAAVSGEADIATREHREGDDLRRVHWRSTAKRGQLMVRRDEQPRQNRATLVLDNRAMAHHGEGMHSSFEWAVSACASIAVWLAHRGYTTRLVTSSGTISESGSPATAQTAILDILSVIALTEGAGLDALARSGGTETGLLVAITAPTNDYDLRVLAQVARASRTAVAISLDAKTWSGKHETRTPWDTSGVANLDLARSGWRVAPASAGSRIDDLWASVARTETAVGAE